MSVSKTNTDLITDSASLALTFSQLANETFFGFATQSLDFWGAALPGSFETAPQTARSGTAPSAPVATPNLTLVSSTTSRTSKANTSRTARAPRTAATSATAFVRQRTSARRQNTTARSWYRKPAESPVETMMKFWGSFAPSLQQATPPFSGFGVPGFGLHGGGVPGFGLPGFELPNAPLSTMSTISPAIEALSAMAAFPAMPSLPGLPGAPAASTVPNFFAAPSQSPPANPWSFWQAAMPWQQIVTSSAAPAIAGFFEMAQANFWLTQPSHNGWTKSPAQEMNDAWSWVSSSWMADPFSQARRYSL